MIKAVLFDLDNTLIDFMTMKKRCTEAAVSAMIDAGLPLSYSQAYSLMFKMYEKRKEPKIIEESINLILLLTTPVKNA